MDSTKSCTDRAAPSGSVEGRNRAGAALACAGSARPFFTSLAMRPLRRGDPFGGVLGGAADDDGLAARQGEGRGNAGPHHAGPGDRNATDVHGHLQGQSGESKVATEIGEAVRAAPLGR